MILSPRVIVCFIGLAFFTGCSDANIPNPFAAPAPVSGDSYYFSEFPDIPIPNDMSESSNDTFITFAPSGIKCGVQRFSGRVEAVSLMNTLRKNMASNGWTIRSLMRSKESAMVFEKPDRVATFQISDGMINTEMRIFVSSRLEGDTGAPAIHASETPAKPAKDQSLSQ